MPEFKVDMSKSNIVVEQGQHEPAAGVDVTDESGDGRFANKTLVKWAALAVGMDLGVWDDAEDALHFPFASDLTDGHYWRPHRDAGDGLRLASHLGMAIKINQATGWTECDCGALARRHLMSHFARSALDATLRAILMTAAEVGWRKANEPQPG